MKTLTSCITAVVCCLLFSCSKTDNGSPSSSDTSTVVKQAQLPPETNIGANTFGCLVNDTVWLPQSAGPLYKPTIFCDGSLFGIAFSQFNLESVSISGDFIKGTGKYDFKTLLQGGVLRAFYKRKNTYYYATEDGGTFEITRLDRTNRIISGRFSFTGMSPTGATVKIAKGRFDVKY